MAIFGQSQKRRQMLEDMQMQAEQQRQTAPIPPFNPLAGFGLTGTGAKAPKARTVGGTPGLRRPGDTGPALGGETNWNVGAFGSYSGFGTSQGGIGRNTPVPAQPAASPFMPTQPAARPATASPYEPGTAATGDFGLGAGVLAEPPMKPAKPDLLPESVERREPDFPGDGVLMGFNRGPFRQAAQESSLFDIEGLPKRELGGPVAPGQPYLVGERGPEVIVPDQSGMVIPNNALQDGIGANYRPNQPGLQWTGSGYASAPGGPRRTDIRRFMRSPAGVGFALQQQEEAGQRAFTAQRDDLNFQRQMQADERNRSNTLADREAERNYAKQQKDMDTAALNEGYGLMLQRFGAEGALDDKDLAFWEHAKQRDPKAAAAIGKMLLDFGEENRKARQDETRWADVPGTDYLGGYDSTGRLVQTLPKAKPDAPPARWVDFGDGTGYYSGPSGTPIPTDKIMREESMPGRGVLAKDPGTRRVPAYRNSQRLQGSRNTLTGEMEWFDPTTGQQVIPGAATMPASPGASVGPAAATPAATVAPRTSRLLNMFK